MREAPEREASEHDACERAARLLWSALTGRNEAKRMAAFQRACTLVQAAERALSMRGAVYPKQVAARKMRQDKANAERDAMAGIVGLLRILRRHLDLHLPATPTGGNVSVPAVAEVAG